MSFSITLSKKADLEVIMQIFSQARRFMSANGNPSQWINGYPQQQLIADEISKGHCWVCKDEKGSIRGTFCFIEGPDPTYTKIVGGKWLSEKPYYVLHRLASDGTSHGIAKQCIAWCLSKCQSLRIDTHKDNVVMQHILEESGFTKCGIIYVANGTQRIAYQKDQ